MLLPLLAVPAEPPGLFARATADAPLAGSTFVSPGLTWVGWHPLRVEQPARAPAAGLGIELSVSRWISQSAYLGLVGQVERLGWWRAALGLQAGFQLVGLEVGVARELVGSDRADVRPQWSFQAAPYASIGIVYVGPRIVLALDRCSARDTPGDAAMLVVGLKVPVRVGGPPR